MKKTVFLFIIAVLFCACGKDSIAPDITIFPQQQPPTKEYYPQTLKWLFVGGDTLFKDTLVMTRKYSEHEMTETSSELYELNFPVWQTTDVFFIGKVHRNCSWIFSNPNQTKSVTYTLLY